MKDFYKFFKYNGKVVDIFDFEPEYLDIFSRKILQQINNNEIEWDEHLPEGISDMIVKNKMFGFNPESNKV